MNQHKSILIIQRGRIGKVLLRLPLLNYLKRKHPQCELSFLCSEGIKEPLSDLKLVDYIFEFKTGSRFFETIKDLRNFKKFDLVVCADTSVFACLLVQFILSKYSVSYKLWWNKYLFSERVKLLNFPEALRQFNLISSEDTELKENLQKIIRSKDFLNPKDKNSFLDKSHAPEWTQGSLNTPESHKNISTDKPLVLIAPGGVGYAMRWPEKYFIDLAHSLYKKNYEVGFIGSLKDKKIFKKMRAAVPVGKDFFGSNFLEIISTINSAHLMISNDSSFSHIAASLGIPVVALWGPTSPQNGLRPWGSPLAIVQKTLACRPCGAEKKCPIENHRCMREIYPQDVMEYVSQLL